MYVLLKPEALNAVAGDHYNIDLRGLGCHGNPSALNQLTALGNNSICPNIHYNSSRTVYLNLQQHKRVRSVSNTDGSFKIDEYKYGNAVSIKKMDCSRISN